MANILRKLCAIFIGSCFNTIPSTCKMDWENAYSRTVLGRVPIWWSTIKCLVQ